MSEHLRRDRGASSAEYIGAIIVSGVLVGGDRLRDQPAGRERARRRV